MKHFSFLPTLPSLRSANRRSSNPGQTTTPNRSSLLPGLPRRSTPRNDERGGLPRRSTPRNDIQKTTALTLITTLILSLFLPLVGFITPQAAQASNDWWNEDYRYRQIIEVDAATPQDSVYITLTLDTSDTTKFKNDCSDLRFVTQSGQQIPYHIVSGCTTNNTQVQVLYSSLPASVSDLYLYYGNPQATTTNIPDPFNNPATGVTTAFGTEQQSPAPVAHWKFDEGYGTTVNSSTPTNYPGTLTNGPAWQTEDMCPSGKCLSFDGVDDWVNIGPINIQTTQTITMSAWINVKEHKSWNSVIRSNWGGDGGWSLIVNAYGRLTAGVWSDGIGYAALSSDYSVKTNTWHYVAGVYDGQSLSAYLDGKLVDNISLINKNIIYTNNVAISHPSSYFDGLIDDPKIYSYSRTQQQIQQDYVKGIQSLNQQQANLSNGLVGHWKMDEASWNGAAEEVKDASGNTNHGTATNATITSPAKFGNGGSFNGSTTSVSVTGSASLSPDKVTLAAWVKPAAATQSGYARLVEKNWQNSYYLGFDTTGTKFKGIFANNSAPYGTLDSATTITAGVWYHVVVTHDGVTDKLYINGALEATQANTTTLNTSIADVFFGKQYNASPRYNGVMDEVRIYNRSLASTEVTQLYNHAPKPVAYYDFEEGSGNTAHDKSGNNNHGALVNNPIRSSGKLGQAVAYNSSNYTQASSTPSLSVSGSISVSAWVYRSEDPAGQRRIISKEGNVAPYGDGYSLYIHGGSLSAKVGDGANCFHNTGSAIPLNTWTHVAMVANGSTLTSYKNGVQVGQRSCGSLTTNAYDLHLASNPFGSERLIGSIDEVKIYNYPRTPAQILQDMQSSMPNELNPVGHWKFDEGQGTTIQNSGVAGSSLDGTSANPQWTAGKIAGALDFNNTNSHSVVLPADSQLPIHNNRTEGYSVSFWVKGQPNQTNRQIYAEGNQGSVTPLFLIGTRDSPPLTDKIRIFVRSDSDGDSLNKESSQPVLDNTWHHVAWTDSNGQGRLYIDGKRDSTDFSYTPMTTTINTATIGALRRNGETGNPFIGQIDDLKIYNSALTPQQIAIDYNQSSAMIAGATSTEPTTSGSGAATTQPSQSTDSKYCVPGSTDYCAKPVGEWSFEDGGGSTVKDTSGNSNNGAWNGSLGNQWASGKNGTAGSLDGLTNYIEVADNDSLDFGTGDMSISTWVKSTQPDSGTILLIDKKGGGGNGPGYNINLTSDGRPYLRIANGATQFNSGGAAVASIKDGKWHHLTGVLSRAGGTATLIMYLDGQRVASTSNGGAASWDINSAGPLVFGRINTANSAHFQGQMDQIRIYNYARTPSQVAWDYNNGKPLAHYKMDECQGAAIHDSSGNNLHGILNLGLSGITTPGTCNSTNTAWSLGKMGKRNASMSFDGVDDYVIVNSGDSMKNAQANNISLAAWIKIPSYSSTNAWIVQLSEGILSSPGTSHIGLYVRNTGTLGFRTRATSFGATSTTLSSSILPLNQWHHVVGVTDNLGIMRLYINGLPAKSTEETAVMLSNLDTLSVGAELSSSNSQTSAPEEYFPGQIDDVQIFNYALTQKQIDVLYNGGAIRWGQ